jgi:hypothetical protein
LVGTVGAKNQTQILVCIVGAKIQTQIFVGTVGTKVYKIFISLSTHPFYDLYLMMYI